MTNPCLAAPVDGPPNANAYLQAIVDRGIDTFVGNGRGLVMQLHQAGDLRVPVIVSDGRPGNASFLSPHAHYIEYPIHEIARRSRWATTRSLRALASPLSALLTIGAVDKVAYVNHWLLVGAPVRPLPIDGLERLIGVLTRTYPDHVLVCSGVVPTLSPATARALSNRGGQFVRSRIVHLVDPLRSLRGKRMRHSRHNRQRDRALRLANEHRRTTDPAVLRPQVDRLHALYSKLYLERHPGHLNPRYEPAFFRLLLESGLFSTSAWLRDHVVEAFNIYLSSDGVIAWSTCGVDTDVPVEHGLLRLIVDDDLAAAEPAGMVVNWGSGNRDFKRVRGAVPALEYDVVFDRHLGPRRRVPWWLLRHIRRATTPVWAVTNGHA